MELSEIEAIREEIRDTWAYVVELQNQSEAYKVLNRMVARLGYENELPSYVKD